LVVNGVKRLLPLEPPEGVSGVVREHWIEVNFILPQPITIVTTVDKEGKANAALKSWVMYCSPRDIMFGCNVDHDTAKNVLETGEFVVNIPGIEILEQTKVTAVPYPRGVDEMEKAGLTAVSSLVVKPPRVKECKAHAECRLSWYKELGENSVVFIGRVVALSVGEEAFDEEKMCLRTTDLRQMLLIPEGIGVIERSVPLGRVPEQ
jgi:flavin reductase (DIM6/NTAB) family NADH-FMN oxidoreductase RutF